MNRSVPALLLAAALTMTGTAAFGSPVMGTSSSGDELPFWAPEGSYSQSQISLTEKGTDQYEVLTSEQVSVLQEDFPDADFATIEGTEPVQQTPTAVGDPRAILPPPPKGTVYADASSAKCYYSDRNVY